MAGTNLLPLQKGVHNLLVNCAGVARGDRLAIISEDPSLRWYDGEVPEVVHKTAKQMGLRTTVISVNGPSPDCTLPPNAIEALASHDHTIFFARIGDQSRFNLHADTKAPIMSYARSAASLASVYGQFDYRAFRDFKLAIDQTYDNCRQIRISCPFGTDITGTYAVNQTEPGDVGIKRFPIGIHKPIPVDEFSGFVALSKCLVSTGSRSYSPSFTTFDGIVLAKIEGNRIVKFVGPKTSVQKISNHYTTVSELFDIEPMYVHSWHAGIHPGCSFVDDPKIDPDRWGNTVFQNPRVLHFHTCDTQPPGEISWNIIDPTIEIDGIVFWASGKLNYEPHRRLRAPLAKWPGLRKLFEQPVGAVGF